MYNRSKKGIAFFLSFCLLFTQLGTLSLAFDASEEEELEKVYLSSSENEDSAITITDQSGTEYTFNVEQNDNYVKTTYFDGNETTVVTADLETGELVTSVLSSEKAISTTSVVDENIKNSRTDIQPRLVFPATPQRIGMVNYKNDSNGFAMRLNIWCGETKEEYDNRYNLNKNVTNTVQSLVTAITAYVAPFKLKDGKKLAKYIVQKLLDASVIIAEDKVISSITADYVTAYITHYNMRFENQVGAGASGSGATIYITTQGNRFHTLAYDDIYPQFIANQDEGIAAMLYANYDVYGFPGVSNYYVIKTVPYCTK